MELWYISVYSPSSLLMSMGMLTGTRELLLAPMVKRLLLLLTSGVMVRSGLPPLSGLESFTLSSSLKETSEGSGVKQPWRQSNTLATLSLSPTLEMSQDWTPASPTSPG